MNLVFKEWNAIIEAMGLGKQTVLIRKNKTLQKQFFLYPTVSYSVRDNFIDSFQKIHQDFVLNYLSPNTNNQDVEIKYLAEVEEIIELSSKKIIELKNYYLWDPTHISNYLENKNGYLWILRLYHLNPPQMAKASKRALTFAKLNKQIPVTDLEPVLNDNEFKKLLKEIKSLI